MELPLGQVRFGLYCVAMSALIQFDQLLSDESGKCNHVGGGLSRVSLSMKDYFKMQTGDLEKDNRNI
jgi:hypothetical protein